MDLYAELDNFVETNLGDVSMTDVAKHFYNLGKQDRWISVEDALPVNTEFYYVVLNGSVYTLWYCPSTIEWVEFYTDKEGCLQSRIMKDVTHWMPTPVPPMKGGEQ